MKKTTHIGNITLVINNSLDRKNPCILLGRKKLKRKSDDKRKRKRIGMGRWVPPGGATEKSDKSQKHAAQRELYEETGLLFPIRAFRKVGILKGYLDSTTVPTWLVHIYIVNTDSSNQTFVVNEEYEEMRWLSLAKLPFENMLQGDVEWLPRIAGGEMLSIKLVATENADKAFSVKIVPIKSFN